MAVVRYNPWGVTELQNEINRVFRAFGDTDTSGATAAWMPSADIVEYDDRFQLYVDLPGVETNAVEVTLESGVLTISGERSLPSMPDEEHVVHVRSERGQGRFHRRFILPDIVNADAVKATGRNGVLEISIPKHAKALPRRIKVAA
jgi:HSP20 family protein